MQFPPGAIIGMIGDSGSAIRGLEQPHRYLGPLDTLDLSPVQLLIIDHTLAHQAALARAQASVALNRFRMNGSTILLFSYEPALLQELCDEIWWIEADSIVAKGDPRQILDSYRAATAEKVRAWGNGLSSPLTPASRKGDGRAEIVSLETLGHSGEPTMTWKSGEQVSVRVVVRFQTAVESPVIGMMIRTRIGLEVYGTNTELEKLALGTRAAGETVAVRFNFTCDLCPKEYTLTAASHDPDGTAHDWVDDAVAFVVVDSRFTAGVANLRAEAHLDNYTMDIR